MKESLLIPNMVTNLFSLPFQQDPNMDPIKDECDKSKVVDVTAVLKTDELSTHYLSSMY